MRVISAIVQYVNKFLVWHKKFGPAQNILGPVKGQGMTNTKCSPPPSPDFWTFRRLWISLGWKYIQFLENWPTTPPFWVKVQTRAKLIFSPLTLHFRCKEFRKSTFLMFAKIDAKLSLPPKFLKFLGHNHSTFFDSIF